MRWETNIKRRSFVFHSNFLTSLSPNSCAVVRWQAKSGMTSLLADDGHPTKTGEDHARHSILLGCYLIMNYFVENKGELCLR